MQENNRNETVKKQNIESVVEIEKIVISHILNRGKYTEDIFLQLKPQDFYSYSNRNIFTNLLNFKLEGKDVDVLSLINYYDSAPEMQFDDYRRYISEINVKFSHQQNIQQFLDIIKNSSTERKIADFGNILKNVNIDVINGKEQLWKLEQQFLDITSNRNTKEVESIDKIIIEFTQRLEHLSKLTEDLTGTTTGYVGLDKLTNGFQGGDLIILAARPGVGKTALAINFLLNAAKDLHEKNHNNTQNDKRKIVLMFSMEMGKLQVCQRIVSIDSGVSIGSIMHGKLDSLEQNLISNSFSNLYSLPIFIDDSSDLSIMDIQSKLKQMSNKNELKLVVVDYLQLLKGTKSNSNMNRQQEVASISRSLKSIARQYNVPIIAIAQLSRKIEERKGDSRKPMLSDLRESGAIEQDADLVCFINYKELENTQNKQEQDNSNTVYVEFIIAKNRNGSVGSIDLVFEKPISKYYDVTAKKSDK